MPPMHRLIQHFAEAKEESAPMTELQEFACVALYDRKNTVQKKAQKLLSSPGLKGKERKYTAIRREQKILHFFHEYYKHVAPNEMTGQVEGVEAEEQVDPKEALLDQLAELDAVYRDMCDRNDALRTSGVPDEQIEASELALGELHGKIQKIEEQLRRLR